MSKRRSSPFHPIADDSYARSCWQPPCDVYRSATGWLVKIDLAGVRPDELRLVARGRTLEISGVRRDWSIKEGHRAHSMEISYNRFARTIELPCDLESVELGSEYRDGMFLIRITSKGAR